MRSPDIEMAVRLYYEKPEITNADIKELFSTGETQTIKIKKAVKKEMEKRGVKSWLPHSVNTEIASTRCGALISTTSRKGLKNSAHFTERT